MSEGSGPLLPDGAGAPPVEVAFGASAAVAGLGLHGVLGVVLLVARAAGRDLTGDMKGDLAGRRPAGENDRSVTIEARNRGARVQMSPMVEVRTVGRLEFQLLEPWHTDIEVFLVLVAGVAAVDYRPVLLERATFSGGKSVTFFACPLL